MLVGWGRWTTHLSLDSALSVALGTDPLEVEHRWHDLWPPREMWASGNHFSDAESALPE